MNRPKEDSDIWFVKRSSQGWSQPTNAGPQINTDFIEGHPSLAKDGTIYFHRIINKNCDIFLAKFENGKYSNPEKLGPEINTDEFIEGEPSLLARKHTPPHVTAVSQKSLKLA